MLREIGTREEGSMFFRSLLILIVCLGGVMNACVAKPVISAEVHVSGVITYTLIRPDAGALDRSPRKGQAGTAPPPGFPLVVILHGTGGWKKSVTPLTDPAVQAFLDPRVRSAEPAFIFVPRAPVSSKWVDVSAWGNYSIADIPESPAMREAWSALCKITRTENIDPRRIYLVGSSMGGHGVWDLLLRHPEGPAGEGWTGAVVISGGGDPSLADRAARVPVFAFCNSRDTIVPASASLEMRDAMIAAGGRIELRVRSGLEWNFSHHLHSFAKVGGPELALRLLRSRPSR